MVSLTIFDSIYDNKTNKRMDYNSFDEFEAILYKLSESTKYPTIKSTRLFSTEHFSDLRPVLLK